MLRAALADLTFALRVARKNPGFFAFAALALAVAIGANTTVFSVVEAIYNFPLPIAEPERVAFLYSDNPQRDVARGPVAADDFLDWRAQATSFERLAAAAPAAYNLAIPGKALRVRAFNVSDGFFTLTGRPLLLGRDIRAEDCVPGAAPVAVLSHGFWQRELGGQPDVVDRVISLDGRPTMVVGIAAEDFFFPDQATALWTALALTPGASARDDRQLLVIGRLRPGIDAAQASAELRTLAERLASAYPKTNAGWTARALATKDALREGSTLALAVLYAAITFVLLIACANVASLLLARAAEREREISLRLALGAVRGRLVRQLLSESLLLAAVGGGLGVLFSVWGVRLLRTMIAPDVNIGFLADVIAINGGVLTHALLISVLAGLLCGLAPALRLSRPDLQPVLREGGRGGFGGRRQRSLRGGLVLAEVTLALALLGTSGALIRSFHHLYTVDPGFAPDALLTFQLALPEIDYPTAEDRTKLYHRALDQLAALPGVEAASATTVLPLTLFPGNLTTHLRPEGSDETVDEATPNAVDLAVGNEYFSTMDIPLVRGRWFTAHDRAGALPVAVVSQATVERFWPGDDGLGKRLALGADGEWLTVVGVVGDVHTHAHSLRSPTPRVPNVYVPLEQKAPAAMSVVLRAAGDPVSLGAAVRAAMAEVDPGLPLQDLLPMTEVIARRDAQNRFFLVVLTALSATALALAAVGIYGLISFSVARRTSEIGVRMALGAGRHHVFGLVVRQAAVLTAIGLALGIGLAFVFVRLMSSQLEGLGASHAGGAATWLAVAAVLLGVALLASAVPARRALCIDPLAALRFE